MRLLRLIGVQKEQPGVKGAFSRPFPRIERRGRGECRLMPHDETCQSKNEKEENHMTRKLIAMLCALALLLCGLAQAEETKEDSPTVAPTATPGGAGILEGEEDYRKLDNDMGYFSPEFMKSYFRATRSVYAIDIDVKSENDVLSCYAYMDDYSLYSFQNMEAFPPRWVCNLPKPPEGWEDRADSLTDEEKEQLGNVVTDIAVYGNRAYGFSAFSGNIGPLGGTEMTWNEVQLDVSDIKKQDGVTPREIPHGELSREYYDCLVLDEDGEFGKLYRFDLATGKYRVYETEGLVAFNVYRDGEYLIECVREDGSYAISSLNLETGEITALDYDLSLFSHTGRKACGLAYDSWGEKDAIVVAGDDGLIYRLFPGEKALVCDDYRGITFNEHTETSMAGSTNYFVFSGDLTWCMLHEYGHESEPDA